MARIRTIKPEFWTHEDLSTVSETAHLLAAALLNYSDDEGYFRANPALIKAACFPLRETSTTIPGCLAELSRIGYIEIGQDKDRRLMGRVVNFGLHQRVDKAKASTIRPTFEPVDCPFVEDSKSLPGTIQESSMPEGKGREVEKEREKEQGKGSLKGEPKTDLSIETLDDVGEVLEHFNKTAQRKYTRKAQERYISPRLKDGATVGEMKLVVDWKANDWLGDPEMDKHLTPETVYRVSKWEKNLAGAQEWERRGRPKKGANGKSKVGMLDAYQKTLADMESAGQKSLEAN